MVVTSLQTLLVHELRSLYDAATHLTQVYGELGGEVTDDELRSFIADRVEESRERGERIERCGELLEFDPGGLKCEAMDGIIREVRRALDEIHNEEARDAWILLGVQKVVHHEICGYGATATWAEMVDRDEVATLLKESVAEAKGADARLKEMATERLDPAARSTG